MTKNTKTGIRSLTLVMTLGQWDHVPDLRGPKTATHSQINSFLSSLQNLKINKTTHAHTYMIKNLKKFWENNFLFNVSIKWRANQKSSNQIKSKNFHFFLLVIRVENIWNIIFALFCLFFANYAIVCIQIVCI